MNDIDAPLPPLDVESPRTSPFDPVAQALFQARHAQPTGKSLFISGLHPDVDFADLEAHFRDYGPILTCRVLRDARTGNSRCIGYVNFTACEAAAAALAATNGRPGPKGGRNLEVKLADFDPSFIPEPVNKIFVRFIPLTTTAQDIRQLFSAFGTVTDVVVSRDNSRAARKIKEMWNQAYVTFATPNEASAAVSATDRKVSSLGQHPLVVKPAENPTTRYIRQRWRQAAAASLHRRRRHTNIWRLRVREHLDQRTVWLLYEVPACELRQLLFYNVARRAKEW